MAISRGVADEVFVVREKSLCVKIAQLIDSLNSTPHVESVWYETVKLRAMRRADTIDAATVGSMVERRRDEPILIGCFPEPWIIDGNHRLERRHRDGFEETQAIVVRPDVLVRFLEELGF